jgi:hypothetical protein
MLVNGGVGSVIYAKAVKLRICGKVDTFSFCRKRILHADLIAASIAR